MNNNKAERIVFLDYMRIFAFVSVLIGHKFFPLLTELSENPVNHITIRTVANMLIPLCWGGGAGVIVFFLTSGYIITHVLRTEAPVEFLVKRVFRIYPLYIFAVILQIVLEKLVMGINLPDLTTFVTRILLIGDFFGTPNFLGGVEWTLRIEVLFYVLMAAFKALGMIERPAWLPVAFAAVSAALALLPPFPFQEGLSLGYLSIYGPLLFIGSCIYLGQHKLSSRFVCIAVSTGILISSLIMYAKYQTFWKESNFAALAVVLFVTAFLARRYMKETPAVTLLSGMTYAVYLFHKWLWDYASAALTATGVNILPMQLQILIFVLIFCYVVHKTVEQAGINLGRKLIKRFVARPRQIEKAVA